MHEPAYPLPMHFEQQKKGPRCNSLHLRDEAITGGKARGSPGWARRLPWKRARPARDERGRQGGAKATWGHLGYRLGLYVIKSSKGLGNRRLRFLAGVLLRRRPNVGLALWQWGKREELERKTGPLSQTKSLVDLRKKKNKTPKKQIRSFSSVAKCIDLIEAYMQVPVVPIVLCKFLLQTE